MSASARDPASLTLRASASAPLSATRSARNSGTSGAATESGGSARVLGVTRLAAAGSRARELDEQIEHAALVFDRPVTVDDDGVPTVGRGDIARVLRVAGRAVDLRTAGRRRAGGAVRARVLIDAEADVARPSDDAGRAPP